MSKYITNSILFKGSTNQTSILAAIKDPINRELIQQVDTYIEDEEVEVDNVEVNEGEGRDNGSDDFSPSGGGFGGGMGGFDDEFDEEFDEDLEDVELDENGEPIEVEGEEEEEVDEEIDIDSSTSIKASTYVTADRVAQAVNEIPGTLNMRDETKGVTHVQLKGDKDNEVWVYYDTNDINSKLDNVIKALANAGIYFLEFDRVARNENAIVFSIIWLSSYYTPQNKEDNSETSND